MALRASQDWHRIRQVLKRSGWVFPEGWTPLQIGAFVQELARDARVLTFVKRHYYPLQYGGQSEFSDAEAESLAADLERAAPRSPKADHVVRMSEGRCSLCGDEMEEEPRA